MNSHPDTLQEIGLGKYSWPQVIKWLLILLVLYAIGSVFISNPFSIFVERTTPVDYSRVMYFHGMTVGLAGITSLIVSQVFSLDKKFKKIIFICTVATIIIGVTGGQLIDQWNIQSYFSGIKFLLLSHLILF